MAFDFTAAETTALAPTVALLPPPSPEERRRGNIDRVIAAIAAEEVAGRRLGFNMQVFADETPCGTTCCIAGWATMVAHPGVEPSVWGPSDWGFRFDPQVEGAAFLGLEVDAAHELFFPHSTAVAWKRITPAHAIRALEILRDERVVDWPRAVAEADALAAVA